MKFKKEDRVLVIADDAIRRPKFVGEIGEIDWLAGPDGIYEKVVVSVILYSKGITALFWDYELRHLKSNQGIEDLL